MFSQLRCVLFIAALLTLVLLIPDLYKVHAQVAGGTLSGTVTDTSGAPIAKATVSVKNVSTGVTHTIDTNFDGLYKLPNLIPGEYEATVSTQGFGSEVNAGIVITVGSERILNVIMSVGQLTQTVRVTGAASTIQLADAVLGDEVEGNTIRELPLNGRDWTQLATLDPGVVAVGSLQASASTNNRGNRGYGTQLSISGARPQQNNYRLDGISVNDYVNGGPGSVLGSTLGVDAIAEFSVLTSNYSAEYGRTSGGVVNAITRSGTNEFHGDVYEFHRNSALDAANFLTMPGVLKSLLSNAISLEGPSGGQFEKVKCSFSPTMRAFGNLWALRPAIGCSHKTPVKEFCTIRMARQLL